MSGQAIGRVNGHDTSTWTADSPLRRLRQRRGLTQVVLADRSGLSATFLSMVENGQRKLSRRDHVNALAFALRVAPSELAPSTFPGLEEWAPSASPMASKFPAVRDGITMARHKAFAEELMSYVARGDGHAAGALLRRIARDHTVSPWLLLDQLAVREIEMRRFAPTPAGNDE
jgi:DNA-binding XRE family transcriptional regulator